MRVLLIRRQAQLDVEEASLWYERKREGLGLQLIAELDAVLRRIAASPLQFPKIASEVRRGLLKKFPYAVYFLTRGDRVEVVAILHQHRDSGAWRRRL